MKHWAFNRRSLARRPHLVALGDSHAWVIRLAALRPVLDAKVELCSVPGATAQGLLNPNSNTNALHRFQRRCAEAPTWQILVFLLGEVDCGFAIWHWAEKHGVSIEAQMTRSIQGYSLLLESTLESGFRTVVLSAPLPTIPDDLERRQVVGARRDIRASQRDRTSLTLEYNERLHAACARLGANFIDVTTPTLNPVTGTVRFEYLNPNRFNHHQNFRRYADLVAPALATAIKCGIDDPTPDSKLGPNQL